MYVSGEKGNKRLSTNDCLEMLKINSEAGKFPVRKHQTCCWTSISPPPLWLLESTEARSLLPWESEGCGVYFAHAEKIDFDAETLGSLLHTALH